MGEVDIRESQRSVDHFRCEDDNDDDGVLSTCCCIATRNMKLESYLKLTCISIISREAQHAGPSIILGVRIFQPMHCSNNLIDPNGDNSK